ncbi:MAG: alpha-galactosidase [Bacteroidia bacterium]|nr:alpha-galactosidase [Bacteroidia bacterium]
MYSRNKNKNSIVLENDSIRAEFIPDPCGKMVSLICKETGCEILPSGGVCREGQGNIQFFEIAKWVLVILVIFLLESRANSQPRHGTSKYDVDVHTWIELHFAKGKVPPFSFVYGGKESKTFITRWKYQAERLSSDESGVEKYLYTYRDPQTGLVVRCYVTGFKDFQAVEWVLKFSNTSVSNTPVIENAEVIDQSFTYNREGTFVLHHAKGSDAQLSDFMPLDDSMQIGKNIKMMPTGARGSSDNTAFPFFNIESPVGQGIMVAVGWTGQWYADVQQMDEKSVLLKSGMARMKLILYSDEEIRTPKICLLFWKGQDRMVGHNQFRRFILAHHTRKIDGRFVDPPLSSGLSMGKFTDGPSPYNFYLYLTENYAMATVERFKQFGIVPEVCWIDAGWYEGGDQWWQGVGNWVVDKKRFPNGLKPVSDVVHAAGAKLLLWLEPERVRKGTRFYKEHREWLLESPETPLKKDDLYTSDNYLFDLGNEKARLWLTDYISDFLRKEGVDYYRQDFNVVDAEGSWKMKDKPGRVGMAEIRHIEGLYTFWDSLLVRFPNLIIDNCASGGRRIDLETVSRSSPLWRTDYQFGEPDGYQNHTYGLNFYLPLHGIGLFNISTYDFRSSMSSAMALFLDINSSGNSIPQMQKRIQDFKRLRPYYYGDYYPLTGTKNMLQDNSWLAYQLNRPVERDGIVMAFRRKDCSDGAIQVKLRGLDGKANYELYDEDSGIKITKTGEELITGFTLTLNEKPGSLLISYKKHDD